MADVQQAAARLMNEATIHIDQYGDCRTDGLTADIMTVSHYVSEAASEIARLTAALAQAEQQAGEAHQIVKELAEGGPWLVDDGVCLQCEETGADGWGRGDAPDTHEPACLWRRAKRLYP